ncbi:MAG: acetyl-CoA C-acetyltransferase [Gammaproteobacteria bacterium]|nr:acetyl-CoA C-acetyltransferase [Gammaproteobacteria bacterium]
MAEKKLSHDIYIVDGARTPFLKMRERPNPFSATDLAVAAGKALLDRQPFEPSDIGEVVLGCVMPRESEANIARVAALRLGCGNKVPAWTVQRNCGSGMQAIDSAFKDILLGRHDLVLAGGTEAMSRAPLLYSDQFVDWISSFKAAKTLGKKAQVLAEFKPNSLMPEAALRKGLSDPLVGLSMGQTAEKLACQFHISREEMDQFALRSHERITKAKEEGRLSNEMAALYDTSGNFYDTDTGARTDTSLEKLAKLKPFFDKYGSVTAGNSSQVTDGAAMLLLANEDAVKRYNLPILGRIVDVNWAALAPDVMGLGPIFAATPLMKRQHLTIDDIDYWEINEAFAAQVLACVKGWENDDFCRKELGLDHKFGSLNLDKLNVDGGAIAVGHPVGASGARIILHLLETLKRTNKKRGMAMICIGGGQGGAMLLERV